MKWSEREKGKEGAKKKRPKEKKEREIKAKIKGGVVRGEGEREGVTTRE